MAYGQRAMPKLVEVLSLPDLSENNVNKCLELLLTLLSRQVIAGFLLLHICSYTCSLPDIGTVTL